MSVLGVDPSQQFPVAAAAAAPQKGAGILPNLAAGANEAIFGALGTPVDLTAGALNLGVRGINAATGANIPPIQNPVGGSDWLMAHYGGPDPRSVQAATEAERMARGAGGALAQVPMMAMGGAALSGAGGVAGGVGDALAASGGTTGPSAALTAGAAGAGGAAGQLAEDKSPAWASPLAGLAGNLAGAGAVGLGAMGARALGVPLLQAGGRLGIGIKQDVGGVRATGSQALAAGQTLQGMAGDEGAARLWQAGAIEAQARGLEQQLADPNISDADRVHVQRQLNALAPQREQLVPGYQPTTAQIVQNTPTSSFERTQRVANNTEFAARGTQNNAALTGAIHGLAPGSTGPDAVAALFMRRLEALEAGQEAQATAARGTVTGQSANLGGPEAAETLGSDVRGAVSVPKARDKAAASRLWQAVDPDEKLALPLGGFSATARGLLGRVTPGLGAAVPDRQMLEEAGRLPSVIPFWQTQQLRSNLLSWEREMRASSAAGSDQALRRLTILRKALDDAIAKATADAAEADPGVAQRLSAAMGGEGEPVPGGGGGHGAQGSSGAGAARGGGEGRARGAEAGGRAGVAGDRNVAPAAASGALRPLDGPNRQAETLRDFLISKGGVRDQGGEFAKAGILDVHHRAGGRLVNPRGLTQDYAREAAAEAGFIPPNATIADLIDAVVNPKPVYRISEAADAERARLEGKQTKATEDARYDAADRVNVAAEEIEVGFSPKERQRATELVMAGEDPHAALRIAARESDDAAAQRNAQASAFGSPGIPVAEQPELPVGGRGLTPNWDAEADARWRAARQATLQLHQTYDQGGVGRILKPGRNGADFAVQSGDVPRQIFTGRPSEPEEVRRFINAAGGIDQARDIGQRVLVADLHAKGIIRPDGTIDATKFSGWRRQRAETIDQFPGLGDRFVNLQQAQITLDQTLAQHARELRDFQTGVARNYLKDDPEVATGKIFSSGNSAQTARQLYDAVKGNADALAGLRRGMVNFLDRRFNVNENPLETGRTIARASFQKFMAQHRQAFKIVFGGQGAQTIEMVEAAINRERAAAEHEATGGANTAQKLMAQLQHGSVGKMAHGASVPLLTLVGEHLGHMVGHGLVGAVALPAGAGMLNALRQSGIDTMSALHREMMLHPDLARALLDRVDVQKGLSAAAQRRVGAAVRGALVADFAQTGSRQNAP